MSHSPLRKETNCLNCGATVQGRYCHICGQENTEPKESFWHMVTHFFYDITHFDGSFFTTLKDLLFKPGFLSKEYMLGRRKKYLHPIRMYVFTSAVFFLVFFSMFHVNESSITAEKQREQLRRDYEAVKAEALKEAKTSEDSADVLKGLAMLGYDSVIKKTSAPQAPGKSGGISFSLGRDVSTYKSVNEYDSVQASLPKEKKDAGLTKVITRKSVALNEKYEGNQTKIATELINKFLHTFPYLLFVSLPLYALFLKLLYLRKRKEFYFADHGVFLIHLYIFTFLFMLLFFGLDALEDKTHWEDLFSWLQLIFILAGVFYTLKALKNFYGQGWGKTIIKFIILNILCLASLILLFTIFLFFSFYQI